MQRVNQGLYEQLRKWLPDEATIYPCVADHSAKYPYVVFNADSFGTRRTKDGVYGCTFEYSVAVWGCSFNQADRLATILAIRSSDESQLLFPDGKLRLTLLGGTAGYADGGFVQELKFEVRYNGGPA